MKYKRTSNAVHSYCIFFGDVLGAAVVEAVCQLFADYLLI